MKKSYYHITNQEGKFLTRVTPNSEYSFTDNPYLAYTYDNPHGAQLMADAISKLSAFKNMKIGVVLSEVLK